MRTPLLPALVTAMILASCDHKDAGTPPPRTAAPTYTLAREGNGYPAGTRFIERLEMTVALHGGNGPSVIVQHRDIRWHFQTADLLVGELLRDDMGSADKDKKPSRLRPGLQGIPIRFHRTEGKWQEEIPEGLDPSPRDRAWLAALAYDWSRGWDSHAYGTMPRSIGDAWSTHDPAVFFNEPATHVSGVMETAFKGVEDHGNRACARFDVQFQFQGIPDAVGYLTGYDLKGEVLHALDDLMDIETRMKGTMEMWPAGASSPASEKAEVDFRITREKLE